MSYAYENHVPSRAEIVIGMAADAIRRWCDRRELANFVQDSPNEADRLARDLNLDMATLMKIAARSSGPPALLNHRLELLGIDPEQLRRREPAAAQDLARLLRALRQQGAVRPRPRGQARKRRLEKLLPQRTHACGPDAVAARARRSALKMCRHPAKGT